MKPHLYIAIPTMQEADFLPATLKAIAAQHTDHPFSVIICVNQPDCWWQQEDKLPVCLDNQKTLALLQDYSEFPVNIVDYSSMGKGWKGKKSGVGWARKTLFDHILQIANPEDILVSLDADTLFNENYFQSLGDNFALKDSLPVISVPYYHKLTEDERANRAILRYELYLRNWLLNLYRIHSPFAFTAIGSALAMKVWALQKIGGITPMKSGEDFYLLQKLRKMTPINNWNCESVFPAARFSSRVFFGTGPAMIKGDEGNWESYPIYHHSHFDEVEKVYNRLTLLWKNDIDTPFTLFLQQQFNDKNLWQPLRINFKEFYRFERAFHEKADGLRLLQFVKQEEKNRPFSEEKALFDNLTIFCPNKIPPFLTPDFPLSNLSISQLDELRNILWEEEMKQRSLTVR